MLAQSCFLTANNETSIDRFEIEDLSPSLVIDQDLFLEIKEEILIPKCIKCHRWMKKDHKILRRIKIGYPEQSTLFTRVADNSMPINAEPLSDEEKQAIYDLILAETGSY